ncbi:hypothetical protein HELRODRAFT_112333 [Helobdella robusta]|uniref:Nicotinate phosphoribosyltransferase n=1 Tax=Helobdella robusta TaxID=6412 RepID=T1EFI8_HELRO|nr:hypothetical protein HELRODRAFT_112333 [Helobdella robusta]ESO03457.1 hypothetical protein HELRODRAFT_112333 [Helobdella robusta]
MSDTNLTNGNGKLETSDDQNGVIQPLLSDYYQITMAYAYWKSRKHAERAVFDLYFRKNPFQGEFTIFAGLEECLKFIHNFSYSEKDVEYLRKLLPVHTESEFFNYLSHLNTNEVEVYAIDEGMVVFPKVPLLRLEGPLAVVQLLETTLLTLVNYASLVATNAARFRLAVGPKKGLLEFGLRRAQGPDGGLSASRYCYMGGFDATSNLLAGKLFGIPVKGTHAHAYVSSFNGLEDVRDKVCFDWLADLLSGLVDWLVAGLVELADCETSKVELAAFISYGLAFPDDFLCLIDTYSVIKSGLPNFCAVSLALIEAGYVPLGVRLDSGDLAYLSVIVRQSFMKIADEYNRPAFEKLTIVASNDINEETVHSLNHQGHCIDSFGIGTHLVTCQKQPALGCVYKLAEVNGKPRIKLSEDVEKVTMPGKKLAYRLYGVDGHALVDLMAQPNEEPILEGGKILCRHPFQESKRAHVTPKRVEPLYKCYYKDGKINQRLPTLNEIRQRAQESLSHIRMDHKRALNPTPYKVSVSGPLYNFMHDLWLENAPIGQLY